MAFRLGLRGKLLLALIVSALLTLLLAGVLGWQAVDSIRTHLGDAYARNFTLLNRERIVAPVSRELALSLRLAHSEVTRRWLLDEDDTALRSIAFKEAEGYREDFRDHSYFVISARSNQYYFNDSKSTFSSAPRYRLNPASSNDGWFFGTMRNTTDFNINVDHDVKLGLTKIWFNVIVKNGKEAIGLAGTGLDLSTFLKDFVGTHERGVTAMVVDAHGAIQAHPDGSRIALNSAVKQAGNDQSLYGLLSRPQDAAAAETALTQAAAHPSDAVLFSAMLQGKPQRFAVAWLPELKWYVVTAVDLDAAQVIDDQLLLPVAIAAMLLFVGAVALFVYTVNRLLIRPLLQLEQSARTISSGDYAVALPPARHDEIGALTNAFGSMVSKIQRHTEELESTVRLRTAELVQANQQMAAAHKKISDSITYASLIQRAILPEQALSSTLGPAQAVLWQPRDTVGGDFYVFRAYADGYLIGVVDCAGHGVPGAIMTMLSTSALDQALVEADVRNPAAVLTRLDAIVRGKQLDERNGMIATSMDCALAWVSANADSVTFCGAHLPLYYHDGSTVQVLAGNRRAIGERQPGEYTNTRLDGLRATFYLTTDGLLDQAGGERGYGFGNTRFADMINMHAGLPLAEQVGAFAATLADYQGTHAQRDDITLVCFRPA
ncbi:Serine phosphatase RsbU, regulator of sigma subunit [Andreprevotia lacus DSM 23236]|jgi:serine phosphatase RsbU (regulator of sigma subunit)|uniref:Serine phosphatase RsbU, regulator of sigma subunit n=1 Tax=Andreprevotia lacus DSM 23236 TaxID=1121001 RepID=A0A1W1X5D0_9NEIS|nr:biofilm regulation protein phosphatase SiaA [Andreprevotia lacus]SMC19154.1 Serine phosphatase RsbU, regulator of sigma subunit [Andreprevotia lacus DSM 23236]